MDIDLLGITDNSVDAIVTIAREICLQQVEPDGLVFEPDSIGRECIVEDVDYVSDTAQRLACNLKIIPNQTGCCGLDLMYKQPLDSDNADQFTA